MTYREWNPGARLDRRVACFWTIGIAATDGDMSGKKAAPAGSTDDGRGRAAVKRILPDGCMDIIWGSDGLQVAGPDTHAHLVPDVPGRRIVAVRFRPGGAGHVFGVPADALTDARLPLEELWGPGFDWDPPRTVGDIDRLRNLVVTRLRGGDGPDHGTDPAAPAIRRALAAGTPVTQVAADLGISERTLRRRSHAAFGYGAKTLQRILRFQSALHLARAGTDLAEVAYASGYADQSHLATEVKRLAGVPITRLT